MLGVTGLRDISGDSMVPQEAGKEGREKGRA